MKKEEVKKPKPKVVPKPEPKPEYYTVKVECMVPAILEYKILAKSPEEAAELISKTHPTATKPNYSKKRITKITVYLLYQSVIKFMRNFLR